MPVSNAIVGIDLADRKQMVVVTDHDSKVLARRTFRVKAWDLGAALDWAADRAAQGRVRRGDGGVRADRAPVAGPGPARAGARHVVRVCAAGHLGVGA